MYRTSAKNIKKDFSLAKQNSMEKVSFLIKRGLFSTFKITKYVKKLTIQLLYLPPTLLATASEIAGR